MIIVVGSTSQIKEQAFRCAFEGHSVDIRTVKSKSYVPEQPKEYETFQGANNRCWTAAKELPVDGAFYAAIENGIKRRGEEVVDFPVLHVRAPDGFEMATTGPFVVVPRAIYDEWLIRSVVETNLTWGDVYAEHTGCDTKDPHKHLTGIERLHYLINTIRPVIPIILSHVV